MKQYFAWISCISLLLLSNMLFAQENSPWKTYSNQIVNGVLAIPGSHKYSLTAGQGFSVYLKNQNSQSVTVSGFIIAKTTCGNTVTSRFYVSLLPGQSLTGSNFDNITGSNGQTSVVTASDCGGVKLTKNSNYINRISSVIISELQVRLISARENTLPPDLPVVEEVKSPQKVNTEPLFDSLGYYKNHWTRFKDSVYNQLGQLKKERAILLDSLYKLKIPQVKTPIVTLKNSKREEVLESSADIAPFSISLLSGLGYTHLPLIANFDTAAAMYRLSYTDATAYPKLYLELLAKLFSDKRINVELSPFASYGINLNNGQSGNHLSYGIDANLLAKIAPSIPVSLCLSGNYTSRKGSWNKEFSSADYDYNLIKYGAGLRYVAPSNAFWIQPGVYWHNPNNYITGAVPSLVAAIDAEIASKWRINLSYGANYLNQGLQKYTTFFDGQQNYFSIKILGTMAHFKL